MPDLARLPLLAQALAAHGLSFDHLAQEASAIALFGSRAHGCERATSDWDLLCVGSGRSRKLAGLDLVWVDAGSAEGNAWLGGDLAGHVAVYGVWLHGAPFWRSTDVRFDLAARRKEERIARRIRSLERVWDLLGQAYRDKHATLVRRDVQRLTELHRGAAVRPTALLDAAWNERADAALWLGETLSLLGAEPWHAAAITEHAAGVEARSDLRRSTIDE